MSGGGTGGGWLGCEFCSWWFSETPRCLFAHWFNWMIKKGVSISDASSLVHTLLDDSRLRSRLSHDWEGSENLSSSCPSFTRKSLGDWHRLGGLGGHCTIFTKRLLQLVFTRACQKGASQIKLSSSSSLIVKLRKNQLNQGAKDLFYTCFVTTVPNLTFKAAPAMPEIPPTQQEASQAPCARCLKPTRCHGSNIPTVQVH